MTMVYFPGHSLLLTSHLLQPGRNGPFFRMEYVREAADAAKKEKLSIGQSLGMHMPFFPGADVEKTLPALESVPAKSQGI